MQGHYCVVKVKSIGSGSIPLEHKYDAASFLSCLVDERADGVVQLLPRPDPDQSRVEPLLLIIYTRLSSKK